jgi:hypothetical protein
MGTGVVFLTMVTLIGAIGWLLGGGASSSDSARAGAAGRLLAVNSGDTLPPAFNVRLVPTLKVGQAGWCTVIEEHGVTGMSACGGVPRPSSPFLQVQGWGEGCSHISRTVAVTIPQVAAVVVNGGSHVATEPLPGLPYGLRAARILSPAGTPAQCRAGDVPGTTTKPLDAHGRLISSRWPTLPLQGRVGSWRYPGRPPEGVCALRAGGVPGLSTSSGEVLSAIRPFPGRIVGHAFLPCIATVYRLGQLPLRATVVLDALNPSARVAALPDFKAVRGAPGFFSEGGLTARRSGRAWLIVGQGSGLAERMRLLRHLSSTVEL